MIPPSRAIVALIVTQIAFHALFSMPYVMGDALCPGSPTRENHNQVEESPGLPIRVVDENGNPGYSKVPTCVADAEVNTNAPYRRYVAPDEQIPTIQLTLSVDRPDCVHVAGYGAEPINVSLNGDRRRVIVFERGVTVEELEPWQVGSWVSLNWLFASWANGCSRQPEVTLSATPDGAVRFSPMRPGLATSFDDEIVK